MGFSEASARGFAKGGGQNPFKSTFEEISAARQRREAEDIKRQDEDRRLENLFAQLDKQSELDTEKEFVKGEISGDLQRKPLSNTPASAIPGASMSLASGGVGDAQGNPIDIGTRVAAQAGLSPRTIKSPKGIEYEQVDSPERQLKQENLKYMQNVNKSMGDGDGADLVYRRADTGEEVSKEIAEDAISKGDKNYIINKRNVSKSGIKESPLVTTADKKFREEQQANEQATKDRTEFIKSSAQETLGNIKEVKKNMEFFGIRGVIPAIPGTAKANWDANIDKVISEKTLDMIKELKEQSKTGATGFGQLNIKELNTLSSAATNLRKNLSRKDAERYLKDIEDSLKRVTSEGQQGQLSGKTSTGLKYTVEE